MSPTPCTLTEDERLAPFSGRWLGAGMGGPTGSWTFEHSDSLKAERDCSLSDILEEEEGLGPYYLTGRQLSRIAERLEKWGKEVWSELEITE